MDCEKKCKIKRVGALRGRSRKKCKMKRVGVLRGWWRVDCEKKYKIKRVEDGLQKKSATLRGLGL